MYDISEGAKIAFTTFILSTIILMVLGTLSLNSDFLSKVFDNAEVTLDPNYKATIREMTYEENPIPEPSIYLALAKYGFKELAQFNLDVDGTVYTDPEKLMNYPERSFYIKIAETTSGLHVWVGDYK